MKASRIIVVVACSIIVCAMFSGLVSALNQDEATANAYWQPESPLPSGTATVTVFFVNSSPDTLVIDHIGVHFDWMAPDSFVGRDLSSAPVTVASGESATFDPMLISIPQNTSLGSHSYYIGIDGTQGGSTVFSWDSTTLAIVIGGSGEDTFNQLNSTVNSKIKVANNANYQSSDAKSLLQQAKTANDQAQSSAEDGNWPAAISSLQTASNLLDQAATAEQNYTPTFWDQYLLIIIVGVVVAAVVAFLLVLFMVRRRKKQPQAEPAASTSPPPAEQPSYEI